MTDHTELIDAIDVRVATRRFDPAPLDDAVRARISSMLDAVGTASGIHLELLAGFEDVFRDANASGHLSNSRDVIAVSAPEGDDWDEKAGYYAERVVLGLTLLGLGTCWVAGSWNREAVERHRHARPDDVLRAGVIVGNVPASEAYLTTPFDELTARQRDHRGSKTWEQTTPEMSEDERQAAPSWFRDGVEAALKAPSALNRQPVLFRYEAGDGTAIATIDPLAADSFAVLDLGIAKLHFRIGAGGGRWDWGDGGIYHRD